MPHLVTVMETSGDETAVWMAMNALGEIGPAAEAAVPSIVAIGRPIQPGVALYGPALEALSRMGPKGHAALVQLIREETSVRRQGAIQALTPDGIAILSGILTEERPSVDLAITRGGWRTLDSDEEGLWWSVAIAR